jgi:amino-acid N-acetyltransferase
MAISKATLDDSKGIHNLVLRYAKKGMMLYRPRDQIEHHIRDYFVCKESGKIVGCVGLRMWNRDAAEIYALAVAPDRTERGKGSRLIKRCIGEARKLKAKSVFTLTFKKSLFINAGMRKLTLKHLPRVVFTEKTVDMEKAYGMRLE